jgi:hypothetical protein
LMRSVTWRELFASIQPGRCFSFARPVSLGRGSRLFLRMTCAGQTVIIRAESSAAGDGRERGIA